MIVHNLQSCGNLVETIVAIINTGKAYLTMSANIIHVTDSSFEDEVLKSEMPVMLDFWAEWCGPCRAIAPVLEELAKEYNGKMVVAKINVDQNPSTPQKYAVRGIPTLMIFQNGNVIGTKVGQASKSQLSAFIDSTI
jgi:thioredoxin 1